MTELINYYKMNNTDYKQIKWRSKTINIDIETAEIIQPDKTYIKIKTNKHAKINKTNGYIEYTIQWKRKYRQQELPFNNK